MEEHRIRQLADMVLGVQQGMADVVGTAESQNRLISVTVGTRGDLRELHLDPRIYRDPNSRKLAEDISDTVCRAREQADRQVFELVRIFFPSGTERAEVDLDFDPFLRQLDSAGNGRSSWAK